MIAPRAIGLVARREIRERWRSRGFRISFVVVLLGVVALAVAPKYINPTTSTEVPVTAKGQLLALMTLLGVLLVMILFILPVCILLPVVVSIAGAADHGRHAAGSQVLVLGADPFYEEGQEEAAGRGGRGGSGGQQEG